MLRHLLAILAALSAGTSAHAQGSIGPGPTEVFSLTAVALGGYDSDLITTGIRSDVDTSASHAATRLNLNFGRQSPEFNVFTAAISEFRYYMAQDIPIKAPMFSGVSGISKSLGRRAAFDASINGNYFPRFQLGVLPPTTDAPIDQLYSPDYGLSADDVLSYAANTNLSYRLSPRTSVSAGYGHSRFMSGDSDYELRSQSYRARLSRSLTRYARLQLGYGQHEGMYVIADRKSSKRRNHVIDAGIHYARPLSLSRRTEASFSTGSTAIDNGQNTRYAVIGSARVSHRLARYWTVAAAYARGLGYVGGFQEPLFSDSISATVEGLVGRAQLSVSGSYANGTVGFATISDYESLRATSRVDVPLVGRRLSLYGTYFYYEYQMNESIVLPNGLVPELGRHGVRVGLAWLIAGDTITR
jgi:hypothetical protein